MPNNPTAAGRSRERSEPHSDLRQVRAPIVCCERDVANRVLPGTIRSNWDNPGQLYNVIVAALNDGFRADILRAAEQI